MNVNNVGKDLPISLTQGSWSHLTHHTMIHSDVKDYECKQCGKRFTHKSHLTKHTLTHSGVKDYKCDDCEKMFSSISYFNEHILRHWREGVQV